VKSFGFVALLLISALSAVAGNITSSGPGEVPGDWTQQWQWQGTTVSTVHFFIETPGVEFANPGVSGFSNSWTGVNVNSQYVMMSGAPDINFFYNTNFTSAIDVPFTYDWWGDNANHVAIDTGSAHWDTSAWSYSTPVRPFSEENSATPEPFSYILGGTGLVGIGLLRRRRKTASK